jgi:3-keto steroid reductase
MRTDIGLSAKPQITGKQTAGSSEPRLGQVFTANVFGHYLLTHWLSPLMTKDTRIVWTSSISALPDAFSLDDIQGLKSPVAYEASKRLTDFLVLTSELPSAKPFVQSFLPSLKESSRPKMYITHPGVIGTSIAGLNSVMEFFMFLAFLFARLIGSPWHPAEPYKGAVSAAFAVLSPQLPDLEQRDGKGKWGSAVNVSGDERVARTEVDGWGFSGRVGNIPDGSVVGLKGRYRGLKRVTEESRKEFEEVGREVWKEMERMREDWEARLGPLREKASEVK